MSSNYSVQLTLYLCRSLAQKSQTFYVVYIRNVMKHPNFTVLSSLIQKVVEIKVLQIGHSFTDHQNSFPSLWILEVLHTGNV